VRPEIDIGETSEKYFLHELVRGGIVYQICEVIKIMKKSTFRSVFTLEKTEYRPK
jgi:hypothetical protein